MGKELFKTEKKKGNMLLSIPCKTVGQSLFILFFYYQIYYFKIITRIYFFLTQNNTFIIENGKVTFKFFQEKKRSPPETHLPEVIIHALM